MVAKGSPFHGHAQNVTGFLGGITFAAMVLLVESNDKISNADILITMTALSSMLFIFSTIGMIRVASGVNKIDSEFARLTEWLAVAGFIIFMLVLPLVVLQFSLAGGILVGVGEIFVLAIFLKRL